MEESRAEGNERQDTSTHPTDAEALAGDWLRVGEDLRKAMMHFADRLPADERVKVIEALQAERRALFGRGDSADSNGGRVANAR